MSTEPELEDDVDELPLQGLPLQEPPPAEIPLPRQTWKEFFSSDRPNEFNHPHWRTRRYWNALVYCGVLYNSVSVPLRLAFLLENDHLATWVFLDAVSDLTFLIDIIWQLFLGYSNNGILVLDRSQIRLHYLKHACAFDVFATVPLDYFFVNNNELHATLRFNRLIRLWRTGEYFRWWEYHTPKANVTRLVKNSVIFFLISHWVACSYFLLVRLERQHVAYHDPNEWTQNLYNEADRVGEGSANLYFKSLFWAITLLTGQGPDHNQPNTEEELTFMFCVLLLGILVFAAIIGEVGSLIANMNASQLKFRDKMDDVNKWLKYRHLHKRTANRIRSYYEYSYSRQHGLEDKPILDAFPAHLRKDVSLEMHSKLIKSVRFFERTPPGFITELVMKLRAEIFAPGDYIVKVGDMGTTMYFVNAGNVDIILATGELANVLKAGSFFGEIAVLTGQRRTASCVARDFVECYVLDKRDVDAALTDFPEVKDYIHSVALNRLQRDKRKAENEKFEHLDSFRVPLPRIRARRGEHCFPVSSTVADDDDDDDTSEPSSESVENIDDHPGREKLKHVFKEKRVHVNLSEEVASDSSAGSEEVPRADDDPPPPAATAVTSRATLPAVRPRVLSPRALSPSPVGVVPGQQDSSGIPELLEALAAHDVVNIGLGSDELSRGVRELLRFNAALSDCLCAKLIPVDRVADAQRRREGAQAGWRTLKRLSLSAIGNAARGRTQGLEEADEVGDGSDTDAYILDTEGVSSDTVEAL